MTCTVDICRRVLIRQAVEFQQEALKCTLDGEEPWWWVSSWTERELAEKAKIIDELTKAGEQGWVVV